MIKHEFFAARAGVARPAPDPTRAPDAVRPRIYEPGLAAWFRALRPVAQPFRLESSDGFTITLDLTAADAALLAAVDGERSLAAVFTRAAEALVRAGAPIDVPALATAWSRFASELHAAGYLGYASA